MAIRIMVVDDEKRIRKLIGDYLKNDGYEVVEAEDGNDAIAKFNSQRDLDLIILDVTMPGKNGWDVCREIRRESDIPIIFLTALGESHDEIRGLDLGADDYIAKPFGYQVFMARVRNVLRRGHKKPDSIYRFSDIEVDINSRAVKKDGMPIEMSPKEYELLIYLINNRNIALERDAILDAVWGYDYYGDRRTVDTHIKNIRAKTGSMGDCIKTIRGFGYMFEVIL